MNIKAYKDEDLFYCYSLSLFHFLKANHFFYLFKDKKLDSDYYYWAFVRTPELMKAVTIYTQNKKK